MGRDRFLEEERITNLRIAKARDEAQDIARLFYHWALWLNDQMNAAFCACSMEELEELRVAGEEEYEKWRRVRESGLRNHHPWLKGKTDG